MTLEKEKLVNDQKGPDNNESDELVADIDEISIADDLTDFVLNEEPQNENIDDQGVIELEEVSLEEEPQVEEPTEEEPVVEESEPEVIELEEVSLEEEPQVEEPTVEQMVEESEPEVIELAEESFEEEPQVEEPTEEEPVVEESEPEVIELAEESFEEEPQVEEPTEEEPVVEESEPEVVELAEESFEEDPQVEESTEEEPVVEESEPEVIELAEESFEEEPQVEEPTEEDPVVEESEPEDVELENQEESVLEESPLESESVEEEDSDLAQQESENIVKVSESNPIVSHEYKPYDTFEERIEETQEESIESNEDVLEDTETEEILEVEDISDGEEILEDLETEDLDESNKETDEPLLSEDEMAFPERFRKMLEESRMEKRGLVPQVEPKKEKKNKKKNTFELLANDLNVEMTDEAVYGRLNEFEQYFYEYVFNAEEKSNAYEDSYYEAKYDYFIDLAEKDHDLNEYINQGFDAWLAKNYKKYTFKGKTKKIKDGFDNLKSIPRFNNREILPYVEKRGRLTIEFLNEFNNDIYLNSDKGIFAKKHSLYPVINYQNEMVCYEYLESIQVEDLEQYAEMLYEDTKQETIEFVKSTREYLDPLSIDYEYSFNNVSDKVGYKSSKKLSEAGWVVSIWMLILCAIIQVLRFIPIPGDIVNKYIYAVNTHHLLLTILTGSVILVNILLLLPSRIKNKKLFKFERAVDRLVGRRSLCRNLETKLAEETKALEYQKMIQKGQKNKIRVNEQLLKDAAITVVDDCAKMRHKVQSSSRTIKLLQFIFVFALAFISAFVYTMLLDGLLVYFMSHEPVKVNFLLIVASASALVFAVSIGLTTKKKSIARWRYHLAVLFACIASIVINFIL